MAFVITPSSTNEVNTTNVQVSIANSTVSTDSTLDSTANLSDATVYAFLANQPNRSQLVHKDLEQIHVDDLEKMDLKWQLALLSMRARKYYQRTGKKITINRKVQGTKKARLEIKTAQEGLNVEDISSKAMVAIDGAGFDWSYMADEEVPTNLALMAFSNSEFNLATYKRGLASVEEQLVFYKKNEVMFCDQIVVLKSDASFKDSEINALNIQIEKLKKEKESNQIKIDNFENASKSLDKLIRSQISDNNRKGVGYNAVPPLPTGLFAPPTIDLSNSGLKEFQQPEFEGYRLKENKGVCENSSNEIKKTTDAPIIEDWVSDCDEDESEEFYSNSNFNQTSAPKSFVNAAKTRPNAFQKSHSPSRRPFYQQTALKNRNLIDKVNTAKVNSVNTAKGNRVTSDVGKQGINAIKSSTCWADTSLELKGYLINNGYANLVKMLYDKKELAIPGQTTTGKEFSNPLMADSLPKTFHPTKFVG
ncbi:hypothetical protein Tco_0913213 [Tanacetum coccineum]